MKQYLRLWTLALLGAGLSASVVAADTLLSGPVSHVRDADTIEVSGVAIRLKGVNAPELGTSLGDAGADWLTQYLASRNVICRLTGEQTYDREVGWCETADGDIGLILMSQGFAGRCARFDPTGIYFGQDTKFSGAVPDYC